MEKSWKYILGEMAKEMGPSEVTRLLAEVVREQAEHYTGLLNERWIKAAQRLEAALNGQPGHGMVAKKGR